MENCLVHLGAESGEWEIVVSSATEIFYRDWSSREIKITGSVKGRVNTDLLPFEATWNNKEYEVLRYSVEKADGRAKRIHLNVVEDNYSLKLYRLRELINVIHKRGGR